MLGSVLGADRVRLPTWIGDEDIAGGIASAVAWEARQMREEPQTLFESLGGAKGVALVVGELYQRVLADEELEPFFRNADMERIKRMQTEFISAMIDGPTRYTGAELTEIHRGRGIERKHFSRFVGHVVRSLEEHGVAPLLVDQILGRLAMYSDRITGSSNVDG